MIKLAKLTTSLSWHKNFIIFYSQLYITELLLYYESTVNQRNHKNQTKVHLQRQKTQRLRKEHSRTLGETALFLAKYISVYDAKMRH